MTVKTKREVDVTQPRAGQKLQLGAIAAELGITFQVMADAAQVSRTSLYRIADENIWPVRCDSSALRGALRLLFEARGASDEQMTSMFHAQVTKRNPAQRAGKAPAPAPTPPDYVPPKAHDDQSDTDEETDMLPSKQILSFEARKAFGLIVNPFDGEVIEDPQMFTSGEVAFVREACLQAAIGGRFVALVGESGAGKTTVLADLEARIERDKRPVIVIKPWVLGMEGNDSQGKTLKASDILASLVTTMNPTATIKQTLQGRSNQVEKLLAESTAAGNKHLLVVEEAHCLPDATLKHLKRLHEMRLGRAPMLGILLLAQPELKDSFRHRASYLREVIQRCEVIDLLPLDGDLAAYLTTRATAHGRKLSEFIDPSGVDEIRARLTTKRGSRPVSLCYPLAVNNLITAAMNTAADLGAPLITRDVVRAV
ncbi:MAG: AAA family ATPase [Burkholderiaceae bacterium]